MSNGQLVYSFDYKGTPCNIHELQYAEGGRTALQVTTADAFPEVMATITVNVPEIDLGPGEVIIKDYAENSEMVEQLIREGFLQPTGAGVMLTYTNVPVCTYTPMEYK